MQCSNENRCCIQTIFTYQFSSTPRLQQKNTLPIKIFLRTCARWVWHSSNFFNSAKNNFIDSFRNQPLLLIYNGTVLGNGKPSFLIKNVVPILWLIYGLSEEVYLMDISHQYLTQLRNKNYARLRTLGKRKW